MHLTLPISDLNGLQHLPAKNLRTMRQRNSPPERLSRGFAPIRAAVGHTRIAPEKTR